jgi:hypothetical protein
VNARRLERDLEIRRLGMCSEPSTSRRPHAPALLRVDHLERVAEVLPALLLDLHDEQTPASPENEIELVAAGADVRVDEPVAAKPVVAKGTALAAIHTAS